MRILLSNDDGIESRGLEALVRALHADHEVVLSAPLQQQSGMAHALTVRRPMELVQNKRLEGKYGVEAWAVAGTPTDSVKLYLEALAETKPDVVISGINHGANLATDILYSGTVGAALEGFLHEIPSFAVSLDIESEIPYEEAAVIFAAYMEEVLADYSGTGGKHAFLYNVNFPRRFSEAGPEFVLSRQGGRDYKNAFQREERADGRVFYTMGGDIWDTDKGEATDIYAVEAGLIAVTPLITDMTDYRVLDERLQK